MQEFKGGGEEKCNNVAVYYMPMFPWQLGAPLSSLSQPYSHILALLKGSSKVYSRKEPIFLWKVSLASILHSFGPDVVSEARSIWDLY